MSEQPGPDEVQRVLSGMFQGDSAPDFATAAIEAMASAHVQWYRAWQAAGAPECRAAEWTGILIASLLRGPSLLLTRTCAPAAGTSSRKARCAIHAAASRFAVSCCGCRARSGPAGCWCSGMSGTGTAANPELNGPIFPPVGRSARYLRCGRPRDRPAAPGQPRPSPRRPAPARHPAWRC